MYASAKRGAYVFAEHQNKTFLKAAVDRDDSLTLHLFQASSPPIHPFPRTHPPIPPFILAFCSIPIPLPHFPCQWLL